jgi:hypothetical protein
MPRPIRIAAAGDIHRIALLHGDFLVFELDGATVRAAA